MRQSSDGSAEDEIQMHNELSVAAQVKLFERKKEIAQVEKELKRFNTINEINRAFAKTLDHP